MSVDTSTNPHSLKAYDLRAAGVKKDDYARLVATVQGYSFVKSAEVVNDRLVVTLNYDGVEKSKIPTKVEMLDDSIGGAIAHRASGVKVSDRVGRGVGRSGGSNI